MQLQYQGCFMRKLKQRTKEKAIKSEISPWAPPQDSQLQMQEHFASLTLYHSLETESADPQQPLKQQNSRLVVDPFKERQYRFKEVEKHGRTLNVIKNYCKKLYTEPIQLLNHTHKINQNRHSSLERVSLSRIQPYREMFPIHKTAIVNINLSFQKQKHFQTQKLKTSSKVLTIQRQLQKGKQSCNKRPSSASYQLRARAVPVTIHRLASSLSSSRRKTVYPIRNFNQLLQSLLRKR